MSNKFTDQETKIDKQAGKKRKCINCDKPLNHNGDDDECLACLRR